MQAIVALSEDLGIGYENTLPWPKIKEDFKWFKECTLNQKIIVGHTTEKTLPLLHKRILYILRHTESEWLCGGKYYANNKMYEKYYCTSKHVEQISINNDTWLCGGASIYKQFLPLCNTLFITHIKGIYPADTYFPYNLTQINELFPNKEKIKEFPGGHEVIKYTKINNYE